MLIRRADPATAQPLDLEGAKAVDMQIMVGRDDGAPTFALRHFVVHPGGHSPLHRHNYEHEVYIVEGEGEAECAGEVRSVQSGDVLFIPANDLHQFRNRSARDFRFLCLVPVVFDCGQPTPGS